MSLALEIITWAFLLAGAFFSIVGGIGILRLPDFFSRMHGGGITDTLGAALIMIGLLFQVSSGLTAFKLMSILFFLLVTSPSSCHALARSALAHNVKPETDPPVSGRTPLGQAGNSSQRGNEA